MTHIHHKQTSKLTDKDVFEMGCSILRYLGHSHLAIDHNFGANPNHRMGETLFLMYENFPSPTYYIQSEINLGVLTEDIRDTIKTFKDDQDISDRILLKVSDTIAKPPFVELTIKNPKTNEIFFYANVDPKFKDVDTSKMFTKEFNPGPWLIQIHTLYTSLIYRRQGITPR